MNEKLKELKELYIISQRLIFSGCNSFKDAIDKDSIEISVGSLNFPNVSGYFIDLDFVEIDLLLNSNDEFIFIFDSGEIYFYNYGEDNVTKSKLKLVFSDRLYEVMKKYLEKECIKNYEEIIIKRFNEQVILDRIALRLECFDYYNDIRG